MISKGNSTLCLIWISYQGSQRTKCGQCECWRDKVGQVHGGRTWGLKDDYMVVSERPHWVYVQPELTDREARVPDRAQGPWKVSAKVFVLFLSQVAFSVSFCLIIRTLGGVLQNTGFDLLVDHAVN